MISLSFGNLVHTYVEKDVLFTNDDAFYFVLCKFLLLCLYSMYRRLAKSGCNFPGFVVSLNIASAECILLVYDKK